ncbi:hypothetical protein [Gemmatimonas sp.]|uniref:hypothetical protein n=1 Tax=Gemmatimonas sp. TaxID=1962908 RepID=UPI0037C1A96B
MAAFRPTLSVAGAACAALFVCPPPAHGQWSAAPVVALGAAIPGGSLRDVMAEGVTAKAGVWMRAPRVPVGITAEAMFTRLWADRREAADGALQVGAMLVNVTSRRHEGRLDPYGTFGAGWYLFNNPEDRYRERHAPGVNVGIGEVIAVGDRDYFVEVRLHAMYTATTTGRAWTTFLPLMAGVRF